MQKAIDCWINVDMGDQADTDYLIRVKEDYLKGGRRFLPELRARGTAARDGSAGDRARDRDDVCRSAFRACAALRRQGAPNASPSVSASTRGA